MKMHVPSHRRDELVPARRTPNPTAPTLQFASVIGNQAMRRLLTAPVIQRSFWDEVTDAVSGVSEWFGGDTTAEPPADIASPMQEPELADGGLEPASDPAFDDVTPPQEIREEAGADEGDGGTWFERWFGEQEAEQEQTEQGQAEETTGSIYIEPESERYDECAQLEAEIERLSEYIRELYERAQAMLTELEALKAQAEALERINPGSADANQAQDRFEALAQQYNAVVDECLYLMEMRNNLNLQLDDCLNRRENAQPENVPLS